jgi:hypothetical protein
MSARPGVEQPFAPKGLRSASGAYSSMNFALLASEVDEPYVNHYCSNHTNKPLSRRRRSLPCLKASSQRRAHGQKSRRGMGTRGRPWGIGP